jgi:hypothetical protein
MRRLTILLLLSALNITSSLACAVCKKDQPKILQGITHGTGPDSNWDYLIVIVMAAVVAGTFILSARYLIKPGESTETHIKRSILKIETYE